MNIEKFTIDSLKTHKEQSLFCRNKLKEICKKYYGYNVDLERIGKNDHGKPYFLDNEGLHFNISHSGDMGVIVVDDKPCGVDIEKIRDIKLAVAKRFFTEEETNWICDIEDEEERKLRFFIVWTGKESYTKMIGFGLTMKMDSFSVLSDEIRHKLKYFRYKDFLICVCSEHNIECDDDELMPVEG